MINEFLFMNGYGTYVISAFALIIKNQFVKEQEKFIIKFGSLDYQKAQTAKLQKINKEILSNVTIK